MLHSKKNLWWTYDLRSYSKCLGEFLACIEIGHRNEQDQKLPYLLNVPFLSACLVNGIIWFHILVTLRRVFVRAELERLCTG